jgi:hypothetical protein
LDAGSTWLDSGATATATDFSIAGLLPAATPDVQIRAVNAGFQGASSSTLAVRVGVPEAPFDVVATPRVVPGRCRWLGSHRTATADP